MLDPVHQALRIGVLARHQELDVQACTPALWPLGTAAKVLLAVGDKVVFVHCPSGITIKRQGLPGDAVQEGRLAVQAGCLHTLEVRFGEDAAQPGCVENADTQEAPHLRAPASQR